MAAAAAGGDVSRREAAHRERMERKRLEREQAYLRRTMWWRQQTAEAHRRALALALAKAARAEMGKGDDHV